MAELNTDYGIDLLGRVSKGMELRNILLRNAMAEKQMGTFEEERNWLKESRVRERTKEEQTLETGKIQLENVQKLGPKVLRDAWIDDFYKIGQSVTKQNYGQFYNSMIKTATDFGIQPPIQLPAPVDVSTMPEKDFNSLKAKTLTSLKDQLEIARAGKTTPSNKAYYDPEGKMHIIDINDPNSKEVIKALNLTGKTPPIEKETTIYKKQGNEIVARKEKESEANRLIKEEGWGKERPLFAPDKPEKDTQTEKLYKDYVAGEKQLKKKPKSYWTWYRDEYSKTNPLRQLLDKVVGGEAGTLAKGTKWVDGEIVSE